MNLEPIIITRIKHTYCSSTFEIQNVKNVSKFMIYISGIIASDNQFVVEYFEHTDTVYISTHHKEIKKLFGIYYMSLYNDVRGAILEYTNKE